jgi:hypothetical protein
MIQTIITLAILIYLMRLLYITIKEVIENID